MWCWFKFNNLRLALGMNLTFYTSVKKGLKTKSKKVLGANSYVCKSYKRKAVRGPFWRPPSWIELIMLIRWTLSIVLKKQNEVYVGENLKPFSQNQLSIRYSNFEERQGPRNCEVIHHFDITFSGVLKSVKSCLTFLLCIFVWEKLSN